MPAEGVRSMRALVPKRDRIIETLKAAAEPMTAMEIAIEIGVAGVDDAANVLRTLLRERIVTRDNPRRGPARWRLESENAA